AVLTPRLAHSLFRLFLLYFYGDHRDLHSFPTRRSSDLLDPEVQALEIARLFSYEQARYYQYKAAYFRLSPERRAKLEAVEELQRPFKLHPAVRAVLE